MWKSLTMKFSTITSGVKKKKYYGNLEFPGVLLHVHERVVRGAVAVPVDAHVAGHAWNVEYLKKTCVHDTLCLD